MKKLILFIMFCLIGIVGANAQWRPYNSNGLMCTDTLNRHVIVSPKWMQIDDMPWVTVTLYDSVGNPIREFVNLGLRDDEEEIAYRIIYKHITKVYGWVSFNDFRMPTMKKQEDY